MPWFRRLFILFVTVTGVVVANAEEPLATGTTMVGQTVLAPPMRPVQAASGETLSAPASLRTLLPNSAYAYVRLPNVWGILGAPTGGALAQAIGSAPYADAVRSVRAGLASTITPELAGEWQVLSEIFLEHATSPMELAVLAPPAGARLPLPNLLLTTKVDFPDFNALNAFLTKAAAHHPQVKLVKPVAKDGRGTLSLAGTPVEVQIEVAESRLYLASGLAPSPTLLADTRGQLRPNPAHPMLPLEADIDESGQGLFFWLNPQKLVELSGAMGELEQGAVFAAFGVTTMTGFAVGIGTSGGIHRFKVIAAMPHQGITSFFPLIKDLPEVPAAGVPSGVLVLGLPSPQDLIAIESTAAMISSPESMQAYLQFKQELAQQLGFSVEDVLAAFGQDLTLVSDEAGLYIGLRLKDKARFQKIIDALSQRFDMKYEQRTISGHLYQHAAMPSLEALVAQAGDTKTDSMDKLEQRFLAIRHHLYWTLDGDYLLLADQPQVLIDRTYIGSRTPVAQWLQTQQRLAADGALLLGSVRASGMPAMMYRLSLGLLSFLGDLVGRPVDLFGLPTPREAGIPDQGAYGFKLASTESRLSFEVAFESNPLGFLFTGGGYGSLAVAGILAAIAIPAYQDYSVRNRVAVALAEAGGAKILIAEFAQNQERFPNAQEIYTLGLPPFSAEQAELSLSPDDGRILVKFNLEPLLGKTLILIPQQQGNELIWRCRSEMNSKYLPASCRN